MAKPTAGFKPENKKTEVFMKSTFRRLTAMLLTLVMLSAFFPYAGVTASAEAPADGYEMTLNEPIEIEIEGGSITYVKFVPEVSDTYIFTSASDSDTYGYLYSADKKEITYNDDAGVGTNFRIVRKLQANTVYYLGAIFYTASNSGSFYVMVTRQCSHTDSNEDGVCDSCGLPLTYTVTEEAPAIVLTEGYGECGIEFTAPYTADYWINAIRSDCCSLNVYDSEDNTISQINYHYSLEAGKTYYIELASDDSDSGAFAVTATHIHTDETADGKCDLCSFEIEVTVAEDEEVRMTVIPNAYRIFRFECKRDGAYRVKTDNYCYYSVYNADGSSVDYDYDGNYVFNAGSTYFVRFYTYSSAMSFTASITHVCVDGDGDYKCDVCGKTTIFVLTEDEPCDVEIERYSEITAEFTPARDGQYYFVFDYDVGNVYYYMCYEVYNSEGYSVDGNYRFGRYYYDLSKDETYTIEAYEDYGYAAEGALIVKHAHVDEDGDTFCDICGKPAKYVLEDGVPCETELEKEYGAAAEFTPETTGLYYFTCDFELVGSEDESRVYCYVYDSENESNSIDSDYYRGGNYYRLTEGETYFVHLYEDRYRAATGTITVKHVHIDEDGDGLCDICGGPAFIALTEDEPCEMTVEGIHATTAGFTPDRNGRFIFRWQSDAASGANAYDNTYVYWSVYDSDGNQINSNYDDFNRSYYYNLSKDETYLIYIFESYGKTVGGTITVTHSHYSEDSETVVEPTLAACGVDSFECDLCGETVYGLTESTGYGKNAVSSGDFVYYIYSDGEDDETLEAAILAYTGDGPALVIPPEIDGIPVTAIYSYSDSGVAAYDPAITSVEIPGSVQYIGRGAFTGLTGLTTVTIGDGTAIIDNYAFAGCTGLKNVYLGKDVVYIAESAFDNGSSQFESMTDEDIQKMLDSMEEYAQDTIQDCEQNLESLESSEAGFFEYVSNMFGTPVSSYEEALSWIENATDEQIAEVSSNPNAREQFTGFIKSVESEFISERTSYEQQLKGATNMPNVMRALIAGMKDAGIKKVVFAGSEEEWNDIYILEGNENLTDAERSYNGEDFYYATFMAGKKVVAKVRFIKGQKSIKEPAVPAKKGYTGKWQKYTLGAADITIKAVYTEIPNPTKDAKITVTSGEVYKDSKVTVIATASKVPEGYVLAVYDGKKIVAKGDNKSVTYELPELVSKDKTLTVKVIDKDGNVQKDGNKKDLSAKITITVKTGFFNNLIAFFKKLFGANKVTIGKA